jgi:hypothetical protein
VIKMNQKSYTITNEANGVKVDIIITDSNDVINNLGEFSEEIIRPLDKALTRALEKEEKVKNKQAELVRIMKEIDGDKEMQRIFNLFAGTLDRVITNFDIDEYGARLCILSKKVKDYMDINGCDFEKATDDLECSEALFNMIK